MRFVLKLLLGTGFLLVIGAAMLAIDAFATDERRASVNSTIEELAEANAEKPRHARRRDLIGGFARMYNDLGSGAFYSAPIDMARHAPAAPDGWVVRRYDKRDVEIVLGGSDFALGSMERKIALRFDHASTLTNVSEVLTFAKDDRLVALRMQTDTDSYRTLQKGTATEVENMLVARDVENRSVLATVHGLPLVQEAQFTIDGAGRRTPVSYRRFSLDVGRAVAVEVITNAADADIVAVLSGLDIPGLQATLPKSTDDYVEAEGLIYLAGAVPSVDLPEPTKAMRAYNMLARDDLAVDERRALEAIAQGRVQDWSGVDHPSVTRSVPVSETLVSLLGPEPTPRRAKREAALMLKSQHTNLNESEKRVLGKISTASKAPSQSELKGQSWWSDEIDVEVQAIVALLPI